MKAAKKAKTKPATAKKTSALDAAARVLAESGSSMTTKEMIEAVAAEKLWESPAGKTPAATLYSAILREINTKGKDSRFKKTGPGKFAATVATGEAEKTAGGAKPVAASPNATKASKGTKVNKKVTEPTAAVEAAILDGTPTARACKNDPAPEVAPQSGV